MTTTDDGRAFWERTAARYDRSMLLLGGPLQPMVRLVAEEVSGLDRVLEVAAGTGLVTRALAPVVGSLVATDYARAMVDRLAERVRQDGLENVTVRRLDLLELDGDDRYDAVVAANVLHLLPDLDAALAAMVGALAPGGRLVVPTYCHDETAVSRLTSRALGLVGFPGQRRLTLERLAGLLEGRGMEVRRAALLPGLLPIGFVSASSR
jgi:ubiquinone/menaquinone biosynthesis C-methylase UbiE